jgi:hypothetical protein
MDRVEVAAEDTTRYTYAEAAEWFKAGGKKGVPGTRGAVQQAVSRYRIPVEHGIIYAPQKNRPGVAVPHMVAWLRESQLEELVELCKPKHTPALVTRISPKGIEHDVQCLRDKLRDQATEIENLRERIRRIEHKWAEAGF